MKPPLEKREQAAVVRLFRAAGFVVGSTSQTRASRQMIGLPDLVLWHERLGRAGWFEVKRYKLAGYLPTDRATWRPEPLSPAQAEVRRLARACNQIHGWGGLAEAEALLVDLGLMRPEKLTAMGFGVPPFTAAQHRVLRDKLESEPGMRVVRGGKA